MVALGRFGCVWLLGWLSKGSVLIRVGTQVREEILAWVGRVLVRQGRYPIRIFGERGGSVV